MVGVHAAAVLFDIHIPEARSLKAKRAVVRPVVEGLRHRFRVSAAEVDFHDQWQRARIGVAVVAESNRHLDEVLDACERFVDSHPEIEVLDMNTSYLEEQ